MINKTTKSATNPFTTSLPIIAFLCTLILQQHFMNSPILAADPPNLHRHTITQTWSQHPDGFDREYFVHLPKNTKQKLPVVFLFHGNGGQAKPSIGRWPALLPEHIIVSPQGYKRSWNISDEASRAPDVAFYTAIITDLATRYPQADLTQISLVGFSNGAGYIYRLLIELDDPTLIKNAIPIVSSMVREQYHEDAFWQRSDDSTANYDTKKIPLKNRNILTVHGTADRVVPYQGGKRGPTAIHLPAQLTAYAWARQQGYKGKQIDDTAGQKIKPNIVSYHYPNANVTHLKVIGAGHGLGPIRKDINELVRKFITDNTTALPTGYEIIKLLGAKLDKGLTPQTLASYNRVFGFGDTNKDGKHSKVEYVDNGRYMTPFARAMIFKAADSNNDEVVTREEYIINRLITDEAKQIMASFDTDKDGAISKTEFVANSPITDNTLANYVFTQLDTNKDNQTTIGEYLRIWGIWARSNKTTWNLKKNQGNHEPF